MKRVIDGFLSDLYADDEVTIFVTGGRETVWLGLDDSFETRWRIERSRPLSLFARHFVEEGVVRRIEADGRITSLVRIADLDGDGLGRVLAVRDDGYLVARGQRILRVDREGRRIWREPRVLPGVPTRACVSGDRLLLETDSLEYTPWGFLGPACLLRFDDGAPVRELRGDTIAALDDRGNFLLTLEGYDVFDTWLVDGDGNQLQTWRSSGHLVPDPDGTVRVLEKDRTNPTRSRVVRLHRDGTIERGPELRDCQCSAPVVLDDGTAVFVDLGDVRAVDRALAIRDLAQTAAVEDREGYRFHARVARRGDRIVVALSEQLPESEQPQGPGRTAADMRYRTSLQDLPRPSAA